MRRRRDRNGRPARNQSVINSGVSMPGLLRRSERGTRAERPWTEGWRDSDHELLRQRAASASRIQGGFCGSETSRWRINPEVNNQMHQFGCQAGNKKASRSCLLSLISYLADSQWFILNRHWVSSQLTSFSQLSGYSAFKKKQKKKTCGL